MQYIIENAVPADFDRLTDLWEESVRATHHFLSEADIQYYKPLVRQRYLPGVTVYLIRNARNEIAAFMGLSEECIEMLFVHPDEQGKGYGKHLIEYATQTCGIYRVDVNEQNESALHFYRQRGFCVIGRSETDNDGKAFPILHLCLATPILETDRLRLRPFDISDADRLFECCQNPNLGNNAGWMPHRTPEESLQILHEVFIGKECIWAIAEKDTDKLIGTVGLIPDPTRNNRQARMVGYWIAEEYWGNGYMTEAVNRILPFAFHIRSFQIISANCYTHNLRSKKVLERCGFEFEGMLHQAYESNDGNVYDLLCYYLTPKQYARFQ